MAAIVQPLGEPTFEDTHREIRRELEHGLDAMGKEQPGLAETCYAAALERASALDPDSRLTANCLGYLAKACAAQRKHKMAATMHERQLLILKELAGRGEASALDRASVLLELVAIYGTLGKEDEASKLRGEVDALMEGVPEPRAPSSGAPKRALSRPSNGDRPRRPAKAPAAAAAVGDGGGGPAPPAAEPSPPRRKKKKHKVPVATPL